MCVCSDHGATPLGPILNTAHALKEAGLCSYEPKKSENYWDIYEETEGFNYVLDVSKSLAVPQRYMMQRIAVARAFAVNPDLLLMDEPYGQLDVKLRFYLEDELVKLWQTLKSTVLFVTHNIEEAVYVADRILVLSPKPTKVRAEVVVDLPRPRDFRDPRFVELRRQVTDLIRWW